MSKIKIQECNITEKNSCEIDLRDIVYRVIIEEIKKQEEGGVK